MGDRVLTEQEKETLVNMVKSMDNSELEIVVRNIPPEWLFYETQRQFMELKGKMEGFEQILKGRVN